MATDLEKLVVQLSADIRQYQKDMLKAQGVTNASARAIERRYLDMSKRMDAIGRSAAGAIIAPLAGISAALSVQEVQRYADTWTMAKNSLAVAGIVGDQQADVLDRLFKSAQNNAAPISALTDLFGKAAQASDNLQATQEDLLRFSDGVAVALKVEGKSAEQASGALTQLGQLLGSSRVQAEEFNSVNEGARPILLAVANGLDEAGGSVNRLKQLVNDGKVSGKQFFDAFLKGMPVVERLAGNAEETIAQGYTKISNALTKFIGETDSSLGSSQRLIAGLNALADNFDQTADMVLKLAAVIAAALVGRSIGAMVAKLLTAGVALKNFIALLRAAQAVARGGIMLNGLAAAAGPVGAVIGVAATAITLFATSADDAVSSTEGYAAALEKVRAAAKDAGTEVDAMRSKLNERQKNDLALSLEEAAKSIEKARSAAVEGFKMRRTLKLRLFTDEDLKQLSDLKTALDDGSKSAAEVDDEIAKLANSDPKFQKLADQLKPLLKALREAEEASKLLRLEFNRLGTTSSPGASPGNLGAVFLERQKRNSFLSERSAEAAMSEAERSLETRTKSILDAASKVGVVLTEAAARIQAKSEIAAEQAQRTNAASVSNAADLLKQFEGFRSTPYWDVNHLRVGYGSDTVTLDDGSVREVTAGISVSVADANRDLTRRIEEAQAGIRDKIGTETFNALNEQQQAALTSIAYNYGSLPDRIVSAIRNGDAGTVSTAIRDLGSDNGGVNSSRRAQEAKLYLSGAPDSVTRRVEAAQSFDERMKSQQQQLDAMKAETEARRTLNPLVDDYGAKLAATQAAQEMLSQEWREGTAAGKELSDVNQLLYGDLSQLTPAAREQALVMRELALGFGRATAEAGIFENSQKTLQERLQQSSELGKDVFGGFLRDIKNGTDAIDALSSAFGRLGDKMLDIGLNFLFDGAKAGSGGGLLGGLFSFLFADGGYTGNGAKNDPAGIVHKGEYVFSKQAVNRIGVGNLEAMHRSMKGYANGGLVSPSMPSLSGLGRFGRQDGIHITVGLASDSGLNIMPQVESVSSRKVASAAPQIVKAASARVMPTVTQYQMQKQGRDYRLS